MKKINYLMALFLLILLAMLARPPVEAAIRSIEGVVTRVSDGDTVQVMTTEGTKIRVRLYGLDAPETEKRDYKTGRLKSPGQPYGDQAEKALAGMVLHKHVRLDVMDIDPYKRLVCVVWLGDTNVNKVLVRSGMAEAYREYLREYRMDFLMAEQAAKGERRGIWSQGQYERPKDFRKRMKVSGD